MAPKTYPQQVADLKQEKLALTDEVERLTREVTAFKSISDELEDVKAQLVASYNNNNLRDSSQQAKLTDAIQTAESEAAHARRVIDENTRLVHVNNQLLNRIEEHERVTESVASKDAKIEALVNELSALSTRFTLRERQIQDMVREKEAQFDAQSTELRNLRLAARSGVNEIAQVKEDAAKRVTEAETLVNSFRTYNDKLVAQNTQLKETIARYDATVAHLPDTKAQLLSILNDAPRGEGK